MDVTWFRAPADDAGMLNACYNALDVHVIHGRAEEVALLHEQRPMSFAGLLTEVGAFAGVLQAFGVGVGDEVVVLDVPPLEDTVAQLACARVGAVHFDERSPTPALVLAGTAAGLDVGRDLGTVPLITVDDTGELGWEMAMRAGRTQPAGCAELSGDAPLRVVGGTPVLTAQHLLSVAAGEVVDPVLTPLMAGRTLVLAGRS
ncbi:MAG: propionyl-CoA synthetase [Nocardioides sp.]|jgi:hypothetical protein|uniref:AMP-binding protein n=1 Tax=Nocardioides sp. TaxID=35761 RepID=UPI00260DC1E2|nr:AMP-binding protein [Nocardioides sp.]MCW2834752.1 propionyl-CoA synthetase [Nocardioides sp.]